MAQNKDDIEVIPPGQALEKNTVHDLRPRHTKASRWWLVWEQARLEQLERVVRAEQGVIDATHDHALAQGRFQGVKTDIALIKLEKENKLADEQRKEKLRNLEDDLAKLDLEVRIAERQKRLAELSERPTTLQAQTPPLPPLAEKLLQRKQERKAVVEALNAARKRGDLSEEELQEALAEVEHHYGRDSTLHEE